MNIKLVFKDCNFNLDVMEDTPCQYLYRVAQKVFRKKQSDLILFYGNIRIENDSRLLFDVMGKDDKEDISEEETIIVKHKKDLNEFNNDEIKNRLKSLNKNSSKNNNSGKLPIIINNSLSPKNKNKNKKLPVRCQICSHKNSIFYCRECNIFICFECNIRYSEHHRHKRINLEDGDTSLGLQIYKEKILGELKIIDSGYKKFSKWVISNIDRDNFLQTTFKLLEKIKKNSQRLSDIHTLYNIDQNMINTLKFDIEQTKIPNGQEELIELFSNINSKDKEIENYIKCVDLQIIKTEYNKVLVSCITMAQKHLKKIIDEVESKLRECEDMKFWGITEVKLYLKDNKKEKINFDIFNNKENNDNKKNGFNDSSDKNSDSYTETEYDKEELKRFKMNLNNNREAMQNNENEAKNNAKEKHNQNNEPTNKTTSINIETKSKARKSIIKSLKGSDINNNKSKILLNERIKSSKKRKSVFHENDEKNINPNDNIAYSNTINANNNNEYPIINTIKNDNILFDNNPLKKGNNLIRSLMSSFSGDKDNKLFSSSKRISINKYPVNLTSANNNRNDNNPPLIGVKSSANHNFKKFKESGKYGKKLVNILRQKTAKKD
jgi:NTP pyrophosphatase (non-canonical NTP hydrolase)